ncbi:MAG: response regulator [Elainella sp. Prado103]|jgi:twitching motility two-component system response regulator PilG|nr:response regulator [Elainella sp. Prado103]
MNSISMSSYRSYQKLHPLSLLAQLISRQYSGCLRVIHGSTTWFIYFERGKFLYATTSITPFDRLDRQLQRLSSQIPALTKPLRLQMRLLFDKPADQMEPAQEYQAIGWLAEQVPLSTTQTTGLIEALAKEVFESFLSLKEGSYELIEDSPLLKLPQLCRLELRPLIESCQHQLQRQQFPNRPPASGVASLLDRSRSQPVHPTTFPNLSQPTPLPFINPLVNPADPPAQPAFDPTGAGKTYTIACIDDSPTVLNAINAYLDDHSFNVVMIDDPIKALMQVIHSKPELILLDVTMPNLDGYELCSLLRKHPHFKHTPIIMVTGKTGLIDRAKARLVGASGYLTKPFSRSDLMKVVFQHLS